MEQDPIKLKGELLTKSIIEEGLFKDFEGNKVTNYTLIIHNDDIQSLLGILAYRMFAVEKELLNRCFIVSTSTLSMLNTRIDDFVNKFKRNYGNSFTNLNVIVLGESIDDVNDIECITTTSRYPVDKTIAEGIFEKYIMGEVEETPEIMDYKAISDLSLTLLDLEKKIDDPTNDIDVLLLIEKFKNVLNVFNSNMGFNRERVREFINSELEKFMIILGVPY